MAIGLADGLGAKLHLIVVVIFARFAAGQSGDFDANGEQLQELLKSLSVRLWLSHRELLRWVTAISRMGLPVALKLANGRVVAKNTTTNPPTCVRVK